MTHVIHDRPVVVDRICSWDYDTKKRFVIQLVPDMSGQRLQLEATRQAQAYHDDLGVLIPVALAKSTEKLARDTYHGTRVAIRPEDVRDNSECVGLDRGVQYTRVDDLFICEVIFRWTARHY